MKTNNMCLGSFNLFPTSFKLFNLLHLTRRITSGIIWLCPKMGHPVAACHYRRTWQTMAQGQQRIKNNEFPAPPLELQLRVLLQGPCRLSWVNQTYGYWEMTLSASQDRFGPRSMGSSSDISGATGGRNHQLSHLPISL